MASNFDLNNVTRDQMNAAEDVAIAMVDYGFDLSAINPVEVVLADPEAIATYEELKEDWVLNTAIHCYKEGLESPFNQ